MAKKKKQLGGYVYPVNYVPKAQRGIASSDNTSVRKSAPMLTMAEYQKQQEEANKKKLIQEAAKKTGSKSSTIKSPSITPRASQEQVFALNKQYAQQTGKSFNPRTGAVEPILSPSTARMFERASENIVEPMITLSPMGEVGMLDDIYRLGKPVVSNIASDAAMSLGEGAANSLYNLSKKITNPRLKDHVLGISHAINDIQGGRPFFETIPITKKQRLAVEAAQDKAFQEGLDFVKKWNYADNSTKLRPEVMERIEKIYPDIYSKPMNTSATDVDNPIFSVRNLLVNSRTNPLVDNPNLSNLAKRYIYKNRGRIAGANIPITGESITLRNTGLYYSDPASIKETAAHELGHSMQQLGNKMPDKLGGKSSPWGSWGDEIGIHDPKHKYTIANPNTPFGRYMGDAMVKPIEGKAVWEASPWEPHSELMTARMKAYESLKNEVGADEAMKVLQNPGDKGIDWMMNVQNLHRFFEPTTPDVVKRSIIRQLPAAIPAIGIGAAAASQQKKNGGWLDEFEDGGSVESTMGGLTDKGFNYNGAWGGPSMQVGGNLWKTDKKAYVDSTLNANKNLEWVKRLYESNPKAVMVPGETSPSTHLIGDNDQGYVFPSIVNINGQLVDLGDRAEDYARETNTGIQFPKEQGTWFARSTGDDSGYKMGTGVLKGKPVMQKYKSIDKKAMGGSIPGAVGFTYARTGGIPSNGPYAKKTKASAQFGTMLTPISGEDVSRFFDLFSVPQKAATKVVTGKYQTPSEAMNIKNPVGAFVTDMILDPINLIGAGAVGKAAKASTETGALSKAYKYNPWAFKPNEENWYRQVGKSAIDDALNTGLIREAGEEVSPRMLQEFEEQLVRMQGSGPEAMLAGRRPISPFFAKGKLFYPMGRKPIITKSGKISKNPAGKGSADYLIETNLPNESFQPAYIKGMGLGVPTEVGQTAILKPNPSLRNLENFNLYRQHWLQGYKKVKPPKKQNGGEMKFYQEGLDWTPRNISRDGSIITPYGQWEYPGEITTIPSNEITMEGVPYPVLGISDTGDAQMMYPGEDYTFDGDTVTEYPVAQDGKKVKIPLSNFKKLARNFDDSVYTNEYTRALLNVAENDPKELDRTISRYSELLENTSDIKPTSYSYKNVNGKKYKIPIYAQPKTDPYEIYDPQKGWWERAQSSFNSVNNAINETSIGKRLMKVHDKIDETLTDIWHKFTSDDKTNNVINKGAEVFTNKQPVSKPTPKSVAKKETPDKFGLTKEDYIQARKSKPVLTPGNKKGDAYYELKNNGEIYKVYTKSGKLYPIINKTPVKPKSKKEEPAKPQPKPQETKKPEPRPQNVYEGSPVYSPGVGSGLPSALIGFANQRGDTTYIKPEDYERFGVPKYGKEYIESKTTNKKKNGGWLDEFE
jgi:hypothetical protein